MKKTFTILIIINISFILLGGYAIYKKGGIDYLKLKLKTGTQNGHEVHYKERMSLFEIMPKNTCNIIFLGTSITEQCDWSELFDNANIKNRGIGSDIISGVIGRLDEIVKSNPKKIFLEIGINDLSKKRTVEEILIDYEKLINLIRYKLPQTKLYIQSILPTDNRASLQTTDIIAINKGLKNLTAKYDLKYVNLFDLLKNDENKLDTVYTYDGVHLYGNAYLIWKKAIENYVNK